MLLLNIKRGYLLQSSPYNCNLILTISLPNLRPVDRLRGIVTTSITVAAHRDGCERELWCRAAGCWKLVHLTRMMSTGKLWLTIGLGQSVCVALNLNIMLL